MRLYNLRVQLRHAILPQHQIAVCAADGDAMDEPETWSAWFLNAIQKINSQKQRPSVERICYAIRQHHHFNEKEIAERLEVAVKRGDVLKILHNGQYSYKDPGVLQSKKLNVNRSTDISRILSKSVRELGEREDSSLRSVERYILDKVTPSRRTHRGRS